MMTFKGNWGETLFLGSDGGGGTSQLIQTCEKCEERIGKRTEIPYLWDCSVCRNLNKDYRCMSCGEPLVMPFRYCSERCMADATDWGVWHPIVDGVVQEYKGFGSKEDAMKYPNAQDAITHGDYVKEKRNAVCT